MYELEWRGQEEVEVGHAMVKLASCGNKDIMVVGGR